MYKLMVLYPHPADPQAFKAYYVNQHLPMARKLDGMLRFDYAFPEALGDATSPWFCIFQAYFPDQATLLTALQSPTGKALAADVPNYSPNGATLLHAFIQQ